jgi:hypothetical protein
MKGLFMKRMLKLKARELGSRLKVRKTKNIVQFVTLGASFNTEVLLFLFTGQSKG